MILIRATDTIRIEISHRPLVPVSADEKKKRAARKGKTFNRQRSLHAQISYGVEFANDVQRI